MLPTPCVFADYAGTFDVSNRTEVHGRVSQDSSPAESLDVLDTVAARLGIQDHRWAYSLSYAATLLMGDLELGVTPQVLQSLGTTIGWHSRRVRLNLTEQGQFGELNSAYVLTTPAGAAGGTQPPPSAGGVGGVQQLAQPANIYYVASRTALDSQFELSRRWLGSTTIEYDLLGGLDAASQVEMPLLHGPRATATLGYKATRIDTVETRALGVYSDSSASQCSPAILTVPSSDECAPTSAYVQATEVWRHRFSQYTEGAVGAGASYTEVRVDTTLPYSHDVYPVALASLQYQKLVETYRTTVRFDAQVAPLVDVRTGILDERAQASVLVTVPTRNVDVLGTVAVARSVVETFAGPVSLVQAGIELDHDFGKQVSVGGGLRYAWQEQEGFGTFSGGMLFVQLTLRAPQVRF